MPADSNSSRRLRVASIQVESFPADKKSNFQKLEAFVEQAAAQDVRLILFSALGHGQARPGLTTELTCRAHRVDFLLDVLPGDHGLIPERYGDRSDAITEERRRAKTAHLHRKARSRDSTTVNIMELHNYNLTQGVFQ